MQKPRIKIIWATIALLVPLANAWWLERWKTAAAERLIREQRSAIITQREADENLAYERLRPLIANASGAGRADLLVLLAELAPSTFDRVARTEMIRAESKAAVRQIELLQKQSQDCSADFNFEVGLRTAREYASLPIAGQAARTFHQLVGAIPNSRAPKIDNRSLQLAETEFAHGEFDLASQTFQQAFKAFQ
jgi:hypothetical protein